MEIYLKQKEVRDLISNSCVASLRWSSAVDLDLHCFAILKNDEKPAPVTLAAKFIRRCRDFIFEDHYGMTHVYYGSRGSKSRYPWIFLDHDQGSATVRTTNEENIFLTALDQLSIAYVVAHNYDQPEKTFSSYDAKVVIIHGNRRLSILLSAAQPGSYCVIAKIQHQDGRIKITNVNKTFKSLPPFRSL